MKTHNLQYCNALKARNFDILAACVVVLCCNCPVQAKDQRSPKTLAAVQLSPTISATPRVRLSFGPAYLSHPSLRTVALSPDGKTLASSAKDGSIRVWGAQTGRELRRIEDQGKPNLLAFSGNGRLLASASLCGCRIYDLTSGNVICQVTEKLEMRPRKYLAFSFDDKQIILAGSCLHVFDLATSTGHEMSQVRLPAEAVVAISGKELRIAWSDDRTIRLESWNLQTWKKCGTIVIRTGARADRLTFSSDGSTLGTLFSRRNTLIVWDSETGQKLSRMTHNSLGSVTDIAFSPEGSVLAALDGRCHCWNVASEERLSPPLGFGIGQTRCSVFARNGSTLAIGEDDCVWLLHRTEYGRYEPWLEKSGPIVDVALSPDESSLAVLDETLTLCKLESGAPHVRFRPPTPLERDIHRHANLHFSPDGSYLAVNDKRRVYVWERRTGRLIRTLDGCSPLGISFSTEEGILLVVQFRDPEFQNPSFVLQPWDILRHRCFAASRLFDLEESKSGASVAAFSTDGSVVVLGNEGGTSYLRPNPARPLIQVHTPTENDPSQEGIALLALSADGRMIARVRNRLGLREERPVLELWETVTGERRCLIQNGLGWPRSLTLSPDGRLVVTGETTGKLQVWDTRTGKELCRTQAHIGDVTCARFSPSGKWLVTGGEDRTAALWNVEDLVPPAASPHKGAPDSQQLQRWWQTMSDNDPVEAWRASRALADYPTESGAFLQNKLSAAPAITKAQIQHYLSGLQSPHFRLRADAETQLLQLADQAEERLRETLRNNPPLDLRLRIERLLSKIENPILFPKIQIEERTLELLECLGTPLAKQMLRRLSQGGASARLTQAAKAGLWRLRLRQAPWELDSTDARDVWERRLSK
jgi:WD40 repeat protein